MVLHKDFVLLVAFESGASTFPVSLNSTPKSALFSSATCKETERKEKWRSRTIMATNKRPWGIVRNLDEIDFLVYDCAFSLLI
ncbi:hypothetical protein V6N12_042911 [Hibiscus sabdariffa]|uniref:Uncharacterized protein n=1 Tax=Hibiscus sabdariffa TaxID=183260 RepID=A0ABR2BG56_9ROSI